MMKNTCAAEQALQEAEERYRILFNSIDEGFCVFELIYDRNGRAVDWVYLEANPAFSRHTGWQDPIGKRVRELQPDLEAHWFDTFAQVAATGKPTRFTDETISMQRWYDVYAFRFGGAGSQKVALLFTDITERKHVELALQASEERHRLIDQATSDIIWDWDLTSDRLDWNEAVEAATGRTRAELPRSVHSWYDHIHPDDRHRVMAGIHRAIDQGDEIWSDEYRFGPDGGPWRTYFDRGVIARKPGGKAYRMIGSMLDLSERIGAEKALRESEERIRIMADGLPLMVWVHDTEGQQQFVNHTFLEFFGVSRAEMKGGRWQMLMHPDDAETYTSEYLSCVRERRPFHAEARVRRGDDQWRWIESWGNPRWSASGEYLGFVGTSADITDHKRLEQELKDANQRYELVVAGAEAGIWDWDVLQGKVTFSTRWKTMRGFAEHEISDSPEEWSKNIHPEDSARVMAAIRDHFEGGTAIYAEKYRVRRKEGSWMWIVDRGLARRDSAGRVAQMTGSVIDITASHQAEEALRKSERRYRSLFQSMEAFTLMEPVLDANGHPSDFRYLEINDAGARIRGMTAETLQGRTILEVLPKIDRYWIEAYSQVILTETPVQFERQNHINGRWYRTYAYCPEKGKVASLILDITERKQAEQALQELTRTLEQKVADRTELAEARAKQLQALAVELIKTEEQEKRRLSEMLHEDLQQILASARMQLQAGNATSPHNPMLESVERLLDESIAKSRSLSHELSPMVLHHSDLVAALQWLVRRKNRRFGLHVELETTLEQQVVDTPIKIFLFRAIQELLFNVVKHAGVQNARVALSRSDSAIVITVSDQGRGFDLDILNSAIAKGGWGLLSLRERASYIGGSLAIESSPGQGSRFTLTVPLNLPGTDEPEEQLRAEEQPIAVSRMVDAPASEGIRVLFADDHRVMRQGLIQLVTGKPNIVVVGEAANGRQAIELARQLRPHVIVMDISMPEMDGIEATRRIKAELPEVRVIGLSMFEDENTSKAIRNAGAEAFVSKAASSSVLLQAIYGIGSKPGAGGVVTD